MSWFSASHVVERRFALAPGGPLRLTVRYDKPAKVPASDIVVLLDDREVGRAASFEAAWFDIGREDGMLAIALVGGELDVRLGGTPLPASAAHLEVVAARAAATAARALAVGSAALVFRALFVQPWPAPPAGSVPLTELFVVGAIGGLSSAVPVWLRSRAGARVAASIVAVHGGLTLLAALSAPEHIAHLACHGYVLWRCVAAARAITHAGALSSSSQRTPHALSPSAAAEPVAVAAFPQTLERHTVSPRGPV